jgi:endonuclease G
MNYELNTTAVFPELERAAYEHRKRLILKLILFLLFLLFVLRSRAQNIEPYDIVIHDSVYTSYYSKRICGPSYVVYKLYKGGGSFPRTYMEFTSPYVHFDYRHSKYQRGHLCPAGDFAYDSLLEEHTFRYYNAVPMTKNLNCGKWLEYEKKIRDLSQTDSLLITCGGCDYFGGLVPRHCFKIVKSLSTGKIYYSLLFDNKVKGGRVYWLENSNIFIDIVVN